MSSRPQKYPVVLFDLEGTLVDFQWNLKSAAAQILSELHRFGIKPELSGTDPDYAKLFNTTREIVSSWDEQKKSRLFEILDAIYDCYDKDALDRWQIYPDTRETLELLSRRNYRMGIVSNCGKKAVQAVLKKFNLDPFFELIFSRNDVYLIKPDPQGLIKACKHFNTAVQDTLFIGDSTNDILPARQINMDSCFLLSGESQVTGDTDHQAVYEISSLSDLADILQ